MKITCCRQVRGLFLSKEILLGSLAKLERSWAEYLITEGDFTLLKSYCSSVKELSHGQRAVGKVTYKRLWLTLLDV